MGFLSCPGPSGASVNMPVFSLSQEAQEPQGKQVRYPADLSWLQSQIHPYARYQDVAEIFHLAF